MVRCPKLAKAIEHIVVRHGPIDGRTRLLKLVYLADRDWAATFGAPYTEARYYRWNHGPFAREILSTVEWMDGIEVIERSTSTISGTIYKYHPGGQTRLTAVQLDHRFASLLDMHARQWSNAPLQALLDYVYADHSFKQKGFGDRLLSS